MYVVNGCEYVKGPNYDAEMRDKGHSALVRREVKREFITAMGLLHWCLRNGAFPNRGGHDPLTMDRVHLGYDGDGPGSDYQKIDTFFRFKITAEHLSAMRKAHTRYMAALHYWREIEPEWREVRTASYADNSTERHDVDKYGRTRVVMLVRPHGDVC